MKIRHVIAVLFSISITCAVAGCGGSGGGGSDEDQIRSAVKAYGAAIADGKPGEACDHISPTAKDAMKAKGSSCEASVLLLIGFIGKDDKALFKNIKVTSVKVNGDKAVVMTNANSQRESKWTKIDGEWKAEKFGDSDTASDDSEDEPAEDTSADDTTADDDRIEVAAGSVWKGAQLSDKGFVTESADLATHLKNEIELNMDDFVTVDVACPDASTMPTDEEGAPEAGATTTCTATPETNEVRKVLVTFKVNGGYDYVVQTS